MHVFTNLACFNSYMILTSFSLSFLYYSAEKEALVSSIKKSLSNDHQLKDTQDDTLEEESR